MWLIKAKYCDGISASEALDGLLDGVEQVAGVHVINQMGDDFGIGLTFEHITDGLQFGTEVIVIFDNAVVYQRNAVAG